MGDTKVVRGVGSDHELYCIDKHRFEDLYELPGKSLTPGPNDPVLELLKQQGFMEYYQKPYQLKLVYELQPDDMEDLPSGYFETAWGDLQYVAAGDHLAMPYVAAAATASNGKACRTASKPRLMDIYSFPKDVLDSYEEVTDGYRHPRDFIASI